MFIDISKQINVFVLCLKMESYTNNTLDQSLYEAVSSAKSSVSTSSGLSTNSQTALLHKKSSHVKRSKRRPHSAVVISHLSHPDSSKLETLATFPPLDSNVVVPSNGVDPEPCPESVKKDISTVKSKCQKCTIYSLSVLLVAVVLALISSIFLLVQLPSSSSSTITNTLLTTKKPNQVRNPIYICRTWHFLVTGWTFIYVPNISHFVQSFKYK